MLSLFKYIVVVLFRLGVPLRKPLTLAAASSASYDGLPFNLPAPAEAAPTAGNTADITLSAER